MKPAKTRLANQWNAQLIREFTRLQEKSNEDELAGVTVWFHDPHVLGRGHDGDACARAGRRRGDDHADSDLQRCHPAKRIAAGQRASGGRRKAGSPRSAVEKSSAAGVWF